MSKLRVYFSISIYGFGAGPNQDLENPLGVGGLRVFDWFFPTRTAYLFSGGICLARCADRGPMRKGLITRPPRTP
jgi:hypothetical protein